MSLLDIISSPDMQPQTVSVQRTLPGTWSDGVYTKGTPTTISGVVIIWQPAFNMNRVIPGLDMHALVDNQSTTELRMVFTATQLRPRTSTQDPDVILDLDGDGYDWTCIRAEVWPDLDGDLFWRCLFTRQTEGSV